MPKRRIASCLTTAVAVVGFATFGIGPGWSRQGVGQNRSDACLHAPEGLSIKASLDKREACSRLLRDRRLTSVDRAEALVQRAQAQFGLRRPELAAEDVSEAIRLRPTDPALFGLRAESYKRMGQFSRAYADSDRAVALAPSAPQPYLLRGRIALDLGRPDEAQDDAATVIGLSPSRVEGYLLRGDALVAKGRYDDALAAFDRAIALDPRSGAAYGARAHAQQMRGNLDAALADIRSAIDRQPFFALWNAYEGDILRYTGDLDGAIAAFNRELIVHSDFGYALVGRALTYVRKGDVTAARADFERALHHSSDIWDQAASARETARVQLAALNSGTPLPAIMPAPRKAESPTSLPTPTIATAGLVQPAPASRPSKQAKTSTQGRRIALVIGNSAYRIVPALPNPRKDAAAVAAVLRTIGFDQVTLSVDADRAQLTNALRAFAAEAAKADWAMVYYAGHGMEVGGQNYLIPVDATLASDRDASSQAVALTEIMASIDAAKKLKLVVLDACRDNPFATSVTSDGRHVIAAVGTGTAAATTRSADRGLGEPTVAGASLVVFAAKHGQVALDGEGGNSPFAVAFAQRIVTPGVEIDKIFRLVRDDVLEATAGRQEPYTYGSLPGREEFFFVAAP